MCAFFNGRDLYSYFYDLAISGVTVLCRASDNLRNIIELRKEWTSIVREDFILYGMLNISRDSFLEDAKYLERQLHVERIFHSRSNDMLSLYTMLTISIYPKSKRSRSENTQFPHTI